MAIVKKEPLVEFLSEILKPGVYPAQIQKAVDGIALGKNAGSEQITLHIRVDNKATVWVDLVFCESMNWKVQQFIHAVNMCEVGEDAELTASTVKGLSLLVEIINKQAQDKLGNLLWEDDAKTKPLLRNEIKRFVPLPAKPAETENGNPY